MKSELADNDSPSSQYSLVPLNCFRSPFPPLPTNWRVHVYAGIEPYIACLADSSLVDLPKILVRLGNGDFTAVDELEERR
jgi:hypothetical protein